MLIPGLSLAQSRQGGAAVYGVGPGNAPLVGQAPPPAGGTPVWVDTHAKTFIEGWTEYDPSNCTDISPGSYTILTAPKHGMLFFDVEMGELGNGDCPGIMFPFAVARYTWTDPERTNLHDPFTLEWSTPDGMFVEDESWIAELAKITQAKSVWWICGVTRMTLPRMVTLKLTNSPSGASSFDWTVTTGSDKLVFSNGTSTMNTSTNTVTVKSKDASTAMKDVSVMVDVQGLSYSFKTQVRSPHQLMRRTDLDQENGRGADCNTPGDLGWQSLIGYEVDDQFGVNTFTPDNGNAGINEKLGKETPFRKNNWPKGAQLHQGGVDTPQGLFVDNVCVTGGGDPKPLIPRMPLTNKKVDSIAQTWFAGDSTDPADHKGCKVQTDDIIRFIDHGEHQNIKSPPTLPAGPEGQAAPASSAAGYPMPVLNVRYLADESAVIAKGRVLTVNELGTVKQQAQNGALAFQQMTATVKVDQVLKGTVPGGVITVEFSRNPDALAATLDQNDYALLFLAGTRNGAYTFADPQVGKMPITSRNVSLAGAQTTEAKLEAVLFASLADPGREVARAALVQVANLGSVKSTQAIRNIATASSDPDFQGLAYIALIRLGDYSLLDGAIRYAEQPAQNLEVQRRQAGIAAAIGDIRDESVLPKLNSLLSSSSVSLRRAAAKALRGISDPSSARFLVRALDDSDADVQYDAVMALAEISGASPANAPARDIFNQNPAEYLGYWKNWWATSGKQK